VVKGGGEKDIDASSNSSLYKEEEMTNAIKIVFERQRKEFTKRVDGTGKDKCVAVGIRSGKEGRKVAAK